MKKVRNTILIITTGAAASLLGQAEFTLDELTYYGEGPHRAAFVVDWKNGATNEVIAWGYRFDADTGYTMEQMMATIAAGPGSNLFARVDTSGTFGTFTFGIGYQNGATPFDVVGAVDEFDEPVAANFVDGIWDIPTSFFQEFNGQAANAGDFYREGVDFGASWGSFVAGDADDFTTSTSEQRTVSPVHWTATSLGISDVELVDQGWYGFGWGDAPSTIPEPQQAALALGILALLGLYYRRRVRS